LGTFKKSAVIFHLNEPQTFAGCFSQQPPSHQHGGITMPTDYVYFQS